MGRKLLLGLFAGLLASMGAAHASDDLSYSYVQVEYASVKIDEGPDGDGLGLAGSVEVGSHVHILAGYGKIDFDPFLGLDAETISWSAGVGYHKDFAEQGSFFGEVGYVDVELDSNLGDASDDGFSAVVGIRSLVASWVELTGGITYVDLSDAGDDTAFNAGVRFNAGRTFSVLADYATSKDGDSVSVGVRIYWGK